MCHAIRDFYTEHKQAGGARANMIWPIVIMAGVVVLLAVLVSGVAMLLGYEL